MHRAQHALQMLVGPFRAFEEAQHVHRSLQLSSCVEVRLGKSVESVGVYTARVESLSSLPLQEIFDHRRCTTTHSELYPSCRVVDASEALLVCSGLDCSIIRGLFSLQPAAGSDVSAITPPPLPAKDHQKDLTDFVDAPSRRARPLGPGEQPSSSEVQSKHAARFDSSGAGPRVDDPLAVMDELVSPAMLLPLEDIAAAQEEDALCKTIRSWMVEGAPKRVDKSDRLLRALKSCWAQSSFKDVDGVLRFVDLNGDSSSSGEASLRVVLPESMRSDFTTACHEDFGHPGVKRTLWVMRMRAWWPTMKADTVHCLANCPTCLFNKEVSYRGEQHIPDNGAHPWDSIQMDLVHLDKARSGKSKALVFYDRFGRDIEAFATDEYCDSVAVLNFIFFEIVPRHGWPRVIYVDRGSNFISQRARKWFEKMGIKLLPADSHMHTVVGGCERFNHSLRELARATHFDHGYEWDLVLPLLVFWYKQLVHSATGHSPFYISHGREAVSPWDIRNGPRTSPASVDEYVRKSFASLRLAWDCLRVSVSQREDAQKAAHDAKYQTNVKFNVNDRVLIRQAGRKSKMHMPYVGPFKIEAVLDRDRYRVVGRRNAKRDHHEFHLSRLKLWPSGADEEEIYLSDEYFDVDKIVSSKTVKGTDAAKDKTLYRVRWQGYGAADDSWLTFEDMNGPCARAALEFIRAQEGGNAGDDDSPAFDVDDDFTNGSDAEEPLSDDDDTFADAEEIAVDDSSPVDAPAAAPPELSAREARLANRQSRMGPAPSPNSSRALRELR